MPLAPDAPLSVRQGRTGSRWERLKRRVFAEETHCWLCNQLVDQTLWPQHPMARTVDHIIPLNAGGPPLERANCRLAHRRCNTVRSNKARGKRREELIIDASTI